MIRKCISLFSLLSQGARLQFAVAIALISVIPLLTLLYVSYNGFWDSGTPEPGDWFTLLFGLGFMLVLGSVMLVKYPANVIKLRQYLEHMVQGELPEKIDLLQTEDDITAIEKSMNLILARLKERVCAMEKENLELQRQLNQAQKLEAIGTLAAGIAHEMTSPVQFISDNTRFFASAADRLLATAAVGRGEFPGPNMEPPPDAEELAFLRKELPVSVQQTQEGIARIADIIKAMKDFASRGSEEEMASADINQAIKTTLAITCNEWRKTAEIRTTLDPDLPLVTCSIGTIKQVIMNLILNAAQAIEGVPNPSRRGLIRIVTRREGEQVLIVVEDNGMGIPVAIRERIFDPFFTTKEVGKGTGQGLSTAYFTVTRKHGGTLTFDSEEGQGTRFMLRLPLEAKPRLAPAHKEAA